MYRTVQTKWEQICVVSARLGILVFHATFIAVYYLEREGRDASIATMVQILTLLKNLVR